MVRGRVRVQPALESEWIAGARYALAWIVPAVFALAVKFLILGNGRGFRVVARFEGKTEGLGNTGLTLAERLTFFRSEILWLCILVPLVLVLALRHLRRPARIAVMSLIAAGASLALFVQARSLEEMGDFVSFAVLRAGLAWGINNPGANKSYLLSGDFFALLGGLVVIALILWWAARGDGRRTASERSRYLWRAIGATYFSFAALLATVAWRPVMAATPYHANILARCVSSLWASETMDTGEFEGLTAAQLAERYREMTSAPAASEDPRYFGAMRGGNVILVALETVPARFLPADDSLDEFPTLKRLEANSFIGEEHFTTYPYSNRALFSVFASCYPSDGTSTFAELHPNFRAPGLAATLEAAGYKTGIYMPTEFHGDADPLTIRSYGFDRAVVPDAGQLQPFWPAELAPSWKAERVARDRAIFTLAKADIARWLAAQQPFAIVMAPQVGHLPYPDNQPADTSADVRTRGRAMLALEDSWLGDLVQALEEHHQLENTIIVLFGDHGIRTRHEDLNFSLGSIDEYSFQVPLRIYAARALAAPVRISWVTSHIDIVPTVLDLLGVRREREMEQGSPIWDEGIAARTTFFLARQAFGADGYHAGERFYMWNQMSDSVSESAQAHFEAANALLRDSSESRDVIARVRRMEALQQVWLERLSEEKVERR